MTISGTDASQTSAVLAVNGATQVPIAVAGAPLTLKADGTTTGTMTITNLSSTTTATNVMANFIGTNLAGNVTATSCSSIPPSSSCTMTFTPGTIPVVSTSFPISGSNTTTAIVQIGITSYFAYIANTTSGSVTRCYISLSDGILSGCTTALSISDATGIAFNSAGTYAYITASFPPTVTACSLNSSTGSLSGCLTTTLTSTSSSLANGVVYNPQLGMIYATVSSGQVYQCSLNSNGSIASCFNSGATLLNNPQGIAINPAGTIAYIANFGGSTVAQCNINSSNGALSGCATNTGLGSNNIGMSVNATNTFAYVTNESSNSINWGSIDQTDGSLTPVGSLTIAGVLNATGLGLNSVTNLIYIGNGSNNMVMQCNVNPSTGAVSGCINSGATVLSFPLGIGLYPTPP